MQAFGKTLRGLKNDELRAVFSFQQTLIMGESDEF
jgi:hypothetical protein